MIMFSFQALSVQFLCLTSGNGPDSLQPRQTFNKTPLNGIKGYCFYITSGVKERLSNAKVRKQFTYESL